MHDLLRPKHTCFKLTAIGKTNTRLSSEGLQSASARFHNPKQVGSHVYKKVRFVVFRTFLLFIVVKVSSFRNRTRSRIESTFRDCTLYQSSSHWYRAVMFRFGVFRTFLLFNVVKSLKFLHFNTSHSRIHGRNIPVPRVELKRRFGTAPFINRLQIYTGHRPEVMNCYCHSTPVKCYVSSARSWFVLGIN